MGAAHTTYNVNHNAGGCLTHRTHPPTHSESQCGGTWPQRSGKACGRALAQSVQGRNHPRQERGLKQQQKLSATPTLEGQGDRQITRAQGHIHVEEAETISHSSSKKWTTEGSVPLKKIRYREEQWSHSAFPTPALQPFNSACHWWNAV